MPFLHPSLGVSVLFLFSASPERGPAAACHVTISFASTLGRNPGAVCSAVAVVTNARAGAPLLFVRPLRRRRREVRALRQDGVRGGEGGRAGQDLPHRVLSVQGVQRRPGCGPAIVDG